MINFQITIKLEDKTAAIKKDINEAYDDKDAYILGYSVSKFHDPSKVK